MSVKLTNFVEINIKRHYTTAPSGLRDTAGIFYYNLTLTAGQTGMFDVADLPAVVETALEDYISFFKANGGRELKVYASNAKDQATFNEAMSAFDYKECVIGLVGITVSEAVERVTAYNDSVDALDRKLFVINHDDADEQTATENLAVKVGSLELAATVLAYYTQFNIYDSDAAQDYAYTVEKVPNGFDKEDYEQSENGVVANVLARNLNCDVELAGAMRNIGGNDLKGNSLTNQFMLLVLQQTLTERLVNLLTQKIKYNEYGINAILNCISAELNRYVKNGFLTTNKVWTDGDLYYKGYKIIDNNTLLNTGFKVVMLPYETLTPEQIQLHQCPAIYILIADSYAIRKIVIDGDLF